MTTQELLPRVKVSDLDFDLKNPRLSGYDIDASATDADIIGLLWDAMDVRELVLSIQASGFFPHEPIIVAREDGKNVVIEGNRRLAAVRLLLQPELSRELKINVPTIIEDAKDALRELPCVEDTRENAWRYLGFKHVNGPAKWTSYGKSQYIADVHRTFGVPLEGIARQIGDTHKTVQRLFRGLMVIEQAERIRAFDREDRYHRHFSFSHLYTRDWLRRYKLLYWLKPRNRRERGIQFLLERRLNLGISVYGCTGVRGMIGALSSGPRIPTLGNLMRLLPIERQSLLFVLALSFRLLLK